jgi:hypothetical protein
MESHEDETKRQGLLRLLILDNLMKLSSDINDQESACQFYIEAGDLRHMLLQTSLCTEVDEDHFADRSQINESEKDTTTTNPINNANRNNNNNNKIDEECRFFYAENLSFRITAVRAA